MRVKKIPQSRSNQASRKYHRVVLIKRQENTTVVLIKRQKIPQSRTNQASRKYHRVVTTSHRVVLIKRQENTTELC